MNIAHIVTAWAGSGADTDPYIPAVLVDYPGIVSTHDVTNQPVPNILPAPNAYTVRVTCDDATLAAIQADSSYVVLYWEVVE